MRSSFYTINVLFQTVDISRAPISPAEVTTRSTDKIGPTAGLMKGIQAATAALAIVVWSAQAQSPELPVGHTAQNIIVPMYGNTPNTTFTVVRNARWAVINAPLATKNADGTTYTLLDGRPCPSERDERGCNTANKIVLQGIINEQETIPLVQPILRYNRQANITALAFEELRVPWSTAIVFADSNFTIKKEEVPKLKTFKDGLPWLVQLAKNIPAWEISAKKLDTIRGTTIELEQVEKSKSDYLKYMALTWVNPQNLVASK